MLIRIMEISKNGTRYRIPHHTTGVDADGPCNVLWPSTSTPHNKCLVRNLRHDDRSSLIIFEDLVYLNFILSFV